MRPLTDGTSLARASLAGDLVGLACCLLAGLSRHGAGAAGTFLVLAAIFGGAWVLTTWIVGTYRPVSNLGLVLAIMLAIPLAVLVRALLRGWTISETLTVAGVLIVFGTLFIGVARLVVALAFRGRDSA